MKEIILTTVNTKSPHYRKYIALVDDEDFEFINQFNWKATKNRNTFYAQRTDKNCKTIFMHKLITGYKQTDHKDGNGLNNQRSNLRETTYSQNQMNRRKQQNTSSKYKGVTWFKRDGKWLASIRVNRKKIHLGLFKNEISAAQAYNFAAEKYFGEYANYNHI